MLDTCCKVAILDEENPDGVFSIRINLNARLNRKSEEGASALLSYYAVSL
jgi:hypothetical protein